MGKLAEIKARYRMSRISAWLHRIVHRRELATERVLMALSKGDGYGLGLMRDAHVGSGMLYPILDQLEREGWVMSYWEQIDGPAEHRPRRRLYRLTLVGRDMVDQSTSQAEAQATMRADSERSER